MRTLPSIRSTTPAFFAILALSGLAACDGQWQTRGEPTRPQPAPQPGPTPSPAPSPAPNPTCTTDAFTCVDDHTLSWCDSGGPNVADCRAVCQDAGFDLATGCDYDASVNGDSCFCDYAMCDERDPAECSTSGYGVSYCDNGQWLERDCGSVCRASGLNVSLGCGFDSVIGEDSCFCEAPAPAPSCIEGENACFASDAMTTCEYGREVVVDCASVCFNAGFDSAAGCGWDGAVQNDSCYCADLAPSCPIGTEACGDGTCVNSAYVCDGYSDCATSADEVGCGLTCIEGEGVCADGYTIEVCEGQMWSAYDCDDVCWNAGFDLSVGCGYDGAIRTDSCWCDDY